MMNNNKSGEWRKHPNTREYWRVIREAQRERALAAAQIPAPIPCELCGTRGFVAQDLPYDHPDFGKLVPCPNKDCPYRFANERRRWEKLSTIAQIPSDYQQWTLARWEKLLADHPEALDGKLDALGAIRAFVDAREDGFRFSRAEAAAKVGLSVPDGDAKSKRCSLVLSGLWGLGKTSLACAAANALMAYHISVIYIQMAAFFLAVRERFSDKDEFELAGDAADEAAVLSLYQNVPVLIIDEFPQRATAWQVDIGGQLINYRYSHQLPTIITTNYLEPDDLSETWGNLVGDRIQAWAHWERLGGEELRKRNPAYDSR